MSDLPFPLPLTAGIHFQYSKLSNWWCDHCSGWFQEPTYCMAMERLNADDRWFRLCVPCADLVSEKLRQLIALRKSVGEV